MIIAALFLVPLLSGIGALFIKHDLARRALLVAAAVVHALIVALAVYLEPGPILDGWFALDGPAYLFLGITSVLFLAASVYSVGYLGGEGRKGIKDTEEGFIFTNAPEAVFTACMLAFLSMMTLVIVSQHMGMLWVAIEATTLVSAPLIYFHRHRRSLEAMWKYILICSVGIAIALLGNLFLAIAATLPSGHIVPMTVNALSAQAAGLSAPWLKAAFIFLLVGYGTKMGLAPLHTWLPDAHSESPSVVSALLSGALLNCAFLGILRAHQVTLSAGLGGFSGELLIVLGFFSMFIAAVFILGQTDYKRMLAYSSVEHMGIMAIGVGLGGGALFGAMLHAVGHSFTKAMLFFAAGNILSVYKTKSVTGVKGVMSRLPVTGILWMAGFLAITGLPPFSIFLSKFVILKAAVDKGMMWEAGIFLALLAAVFIGMTSGFMKMLQGGTEEVPQKVKEPLSLVMPACVLCFLVALIGVYQPEAFRRLIEHAAAVFKGI